MNPAEHDPPFSIRNLFFGRDGLRAGWAILLFLFLRELMQASGVALLQALAWHGTGSAGTGSILRPGAILASEGMALITIAVPTWLMGKAERRSVSEYGFSGRRGVRHLLGGFAWGAALLSLLVFVLRASGMLVFDARLLNGGSALRYGVVWLLGFLLVGLVEETLFRGYIQFTLARGVAGVGRMMGSPHAGAIGFWSAALLLSFGFGLTHSSNAGESPVGLVAAALVAVVFCLSLWRTGSLWWAIGFHTAWDWAQSFLYGVSDSGIAIEGRLFATHTAGRAILSGGLTGPEGSLFILPIIGLAAAAVMLTLPKTAARHEAAGLDLS